MAPWKSLGAILLVSVGIGAQGADEGRYFEGNAVPDRNHPPIKDCTVTGKIYKPLTPVPEGHPDPFTPQIAWDWCQNLCAKSSVTDLYGSVYPCQHFAFYPSGKCYLGGINTVLEDDDFCNATNPCEHDFHVISGPPACSNTSNWAFPPAEGQAAAPATEAATPAAPASTSAAAETESASTSAAAETESASTSAAAETTAVVTTAAPTTQVPESSATTQVPTPLGKGANCGAGGPPCEDGLYCLGDDNVPGITGVCTEQGPKDIPVVTPPTVTNMLPLTPAPPIIATTTAPPRPENSTIVGYYYLPHNMPATAKVLAPNWLACQQLCHSTPSCQHFGFWPDGGCHRQDNNVTLVKASDRCVNLTNCSGLEVISGPRDLSDENLWPSVDLANLEKTTAATATAAPAPAPFTKIDDGPAPAPTAAPAPAGENDGTEEKKKSSGGGGVSWILGLLAVLVVIGCAYAAYSMGLFGDSYKGYDDDESDAEDPEDGEGPPQE